MKDRFINILNFVTEYSWYMEGAYASPYIIESVKEVAENMFKLEATPSLLFSLPGSPVPKVEKRSEQMFVEFHPPAPDTDVMTIRIQYVFGGLQTMGLDLDPVAREFLAFLTKNVMSFAGTSAYIGIRHIDDKMYALLNCMLHFLVEWSDEQISRILCFQLAMMYKGLEYSSDMSSPILIRFD
jgi:hypothetical protein